MIETTLEPQSDVERIALKFLDGMGPDLESFKSTYARLLAEDAVWESVGLPARNGRQACIDYLDQLNARTGMTYCVIRVHALASNATQVFTEREDIMYRADGSEFQSFRVCGVIEISGGLIHRYTDYLDLSGYRQPA